ncbi:MAG: outer membrane protein assembly factor BamE [Candidatus Obscuribacterales bacterium]|nr:outer membrane protein assembly factor BamE [Candidatus Obscuribacterales bacterium]
MERSGATDSTKQQSDSGNGNEPEKGSPKKGFPILAAGIVAAVIGGLAFFASTLFSAPIGFDSEKWKNEPCCRQRMVKSLEATHPLIGMTKDQVRALLGKADKETDAAWQYTYSGQDAGLDLNWDASGKVAAH